MSEKISFTVEKAYAGKSNSFGPVGESKIVTMKYNLGFNKDRQYGWYELYDLESGGNDFYAEGGLWFKENELVDYDGIFALPIVILEKLKEEWNLNVEDMMRVMKK